MKSYSVTIQMKATERYFSQAFNCRYAIKDNLTSYSLIRSLSKVPIR